MSTGTEIITDALQQIGVVSVVTPPAPESIDAGLKALNSMLEMWLSRNIVIGTTPLDKAGDDLNEPGDTRNAIVTNLALEVAPLFSSGKQIVSPELRSNARRGFMSVKSLYGSVTIPDKVLSSTTPIGAGNRLNSGFGSNAFWPRGKTVKN